MGRRSATLLATAMTGAMVLLSATAWACTNFIQIETLTPATEITPGPLAITGKGAAGLGLVELRWNALDGLVVGSAQADQGGRFAISATVPDVPSGIYVLIASDGKNPLGRAAVEVGTGSSAGSPELAMIKSGSAIASAGEGSTPYVLGIGLAMVAAASGVAVMALRRRRALAPASRQ